MSGPLSGVRVIELAGLGPAPFCAMYLADLGAHVVRVDRPGQGSGTDTTTNPYDVLSRGRRGVRLDLRSQDGSALLGSLAETADVLIEGFRPGVAERLGVGPDQLMERNPRLVYGRMTGWGQSGPLASEAGHDLTYLAVAGVLAHVGRAGQPPTPPLNLVADFGGGGMLLAAGILAALVERATSGRGQVVDAAMVDGAALLMAPLFGAWSSGFWSEERGTNLLDSGAPFYDVYECSDGRWLAIAAIEPQFYSALLEGLDLAGEPSLPDQGDQSRWSELRAAIAARVATRTRDEWAAHFQGTDACVAPVLTMGEAPSHPHATDRSSFLHVGEVAQPGPAPRFDRTPATSPAPAVENADPAEVLAEWGLDRDELDRLLSAGTIG